MSIKMRILTYTSKSKFPMYAQIVKDQYQLSVNSVDSIPPAYSCDNERLVLMGVSLSDEVPNQLQLFAKELTKQRAQNVALFVDGKPEAAEKLIAILTQAGTKVFSEVLYIKGGSPIKFLNKVSDEEKATFLAWVDRVVKGL